MKSAITKLIKELEAQTQLALEDFKKDQSVDTKNALENQKQNTDLSLENKLKDLERIILDKIETISTNKNDKLKELMSSQTENRIKNLDKTLIEFINKIKEDLTQAIKTNEASVINLKSDLKQTKIDVKELKIYKYSKENQMGAIIDSIELLGESIDDNDWRVLFNLETLKKHIDGKILEPRYIADIEAQLSRIENKPEYKIIVSDIRKVYAS